ncbi:hypothetical protein DSO57_1013640 [Entomophthora muscae]|uniref:Uncharacterized protein n=1 Tax=Entomophthora muscae TaxID=34485 RepID=A0ACC2T5W0_9FUNG|nr:hypothetical protein DSO57_1013640 [Entomophthora muscae]
MKRLGTEFEEPGERIYFLEKHALELHKKLKEGMKALDEQVRAEVHRHLLFPDRARVNSLEAKAVSLESTLEG